MTPTPVSCRESIEKQLTKDHSPLTQPEALRLIHRCPFWGELWSLMCAVFWASATILFRVAVRGIPAIELGLFKNSFALVLFFCDLVSISGFGCPG